MEETKEQQGLHHFLRFCIYLSVTLDILIFIYRPRISSFPLSARYGVDEIFTSLTGIGIYASPLYSRAFLRFRGVFVCLGPRRKNEKDLV
jgi:hypothetical protein